MLGRLITALLPMLSVIASARADVEYAAVEPGYVVALPRDEGSHPQFQTEWWYLTGWLEDPTGRTFGFQVTFFRHRPGFDEDNPSRFATKQLLFAHASLSDAKEGRLLRDEKIARAGFGLAEAGEGSLDVHIDDWSLRRPANPGAIRTEIIADDFRFSLSLDQSQPPLLQGRDGVSQKGPDKKSSSYYYSLPQLQTSGTLSLRGESYSVRGIAWLDHEWFSSIMDERAHGWDWIGINLDDGASLMAFRMRNARREKHWAAATRRDGSGSVETFASDAVEWEVMRRWRSPRTGIEYPVEWRVRVGTRSIALRPFMDDQENDARGSTGTIYWEGAVRAYDESGRPIGRGYLELTGYGERIRF